MQQSAALGVGTAVQGPSTRIWIRADMALSYSSPTSAHRRLATHSKRRGPRLATHAQLQPGGGPWWLGVIGGRGRRRSGRIAPPPRTRNRRPCRTNRIAPWPPETKHTDEAKPWTEWPVELTECSTVSHPSLSFLPYPLLALHPHFHPRDPARPAIGIHTEELGDLCTCQLDGLEAQCPANALALITQHYGPSWRTPKSCKNRAKCDAPSP